MATPARKHPPALPHGELVEVLPDLWFVTGSLRLPGLMPIRFGRNMTAIRRGDRVVLVNSVRLDAAGLAALDRLGKVTDVIRLAGNHGMDDPFYAERYGATVWTVRGQRYTAGLDTSVPQTYFTGHKELDPERELPIAGARLWVIDSTPPEALLYLPEHGGTVISGDSLQNWAVPDPYCNWLARIGMKRMGFFKPCNIGPAWLRRCRPPVAQLRALLDHAFTNLLPAHGTPVLGDARSR